jgi:hypothetical protein
MPPTLNKSYCNDEFPMLSFIFALYCDPEFDNEHRAWAQSVESVKSLKSARYSATEEPRPTLEELRNPAMYLKYLEFYTSNRTAPSPRGGPIRPFPDGAIRLIAEEVPLLGYLVEEKRESVAEKGESRAQYYAPTTAQVADGVQKYLLPELTGTPVLKEPPLRPPYPEKEYNLSPNTDPAAPKMTRDRPVRTAASTLAPHPVRPLLGCLGTIFLDGNLDSGSPFRTHPDAFLRPHKLTPEIHAILKGFAHSENRYLSATVAQALAPALIDELDMAPAVW